jgi:hypothetical protein
VVSTNTSSDPTAGETPYASLTNVVENAGESSGKQTVRLYDLDFDQHYVVVIVGVDRAGNEGPAGMWSWATNNTIKFAVTQGVVRARSAINTMLPEAGSEAYADIGMARITDTNLTKAAVLYWYAAGQTNNETTGVRSGPVKKYYDLIYRDAPSFSENGREQWKMASTDGNTGTSKTNWNYQADAGLSTPGRLRFFRASYSGRWQDAVTNAGKVTTQRPLASEEVYSMNNIVVSEGYNFVSLQGTPWTNTFEGVFGTDPDMWPGGESASDTNATQVAFFEPGTTQTTNEWFYFGKDGEWHDSAMGVVTTNQQREGFFARPFSLTLPHSNAWWDAHGDYEGAKASKSKSVKAMLWHPIMQVPTNGPVDGVFSNSITRGEGTYNLLSLNLPVETHPSKLGLVEIVEKVENNVTNRVPTTNAPDIKMYASDDRRNADKLYVVDSATKEVRGESMMYCGSDGTWRFVRGGGVVPDGFIRPNDMLVLVSGVAPSGAPSPWTWLYSPTNFYAPPTRHMGR